MWCAFAPTWQDTWCAPTQSECFMRDVALKGNASNFTPPRHRRVRRRSQTRCSCSTRPRRRPRRARDTISNVCEVRPERRPRERGARAPRRTRVQRVRGRQHRRRRLKASRARAHTTSTTATSSSLSAATSRRPAGWTPAQRGVHGASPGGRIAPRPQRAPPARRRRATRTTSSRSAALPAATP